MDATDADEARLRHAGAVLCDVDHSFDANHQTRDGLAERYRPSALIRVSNHGLSTDASDIPPRGTDTNALSFPVADVPIS